MEPLPSVKIQPPQGWRRVNFHELWEYRELFFFLTWRDLKVRYKQTILGVGWALLQPLFTMIVFTIFFGRLAGIPSDGVPYSLFALTGLLPWTFFSNGVINSTNSLVSDSNLIKKVYFPRVILPTASVTAAFFDLLLTFSLLLIMMPFMSTYPSFRLLFAPLVFGFVYLTSLGIAFWLTAFNVLFRDVRYVIPFLLQLWMFVSPIAYPASLIPEKWRIIYGINPIVGIVETFRWMLLGEQYAFSLHPSVILFSVSISITLFISGFLYFKKIETSFADVV